MTHTVNLALVGMGRFGRQFLRNSPSFPQVTIRALVDRLPPATLEHLLKYDTAFGRLNATAHVSGEQLMFNDQPMRLFSDAQADMDWKALGVDTLVVDAQSVTPSSEWVAKQQARGVSRILVVNGSTDSTVATPFAVGLGDASAAKDASVVTLSSPEALGAALVLKSLHEAFGIERASLTQITASSSKQSLSDVQNKDFRRSRAAGVNVVPTLSGFTQEVTALLPDLATKVVGMTCYVPVSRGTCLDITLEVRSQPTPTDVRQSLVHASEGPYKGLMACSDQPLVSSDYAGEHAAVVIDAPSISVLDGRMVHVMAWLDETTSAVSRCFSFLATR